MFFYLLYIFIMILQLSLGIFMLYLVVSFVTGAPFVPSTNPTALSMIRLAHIKKNSKVYDLGSGNGKLLFLAAQKGAIAVGYELNPFLVLYSNILAYMSPHKKTVKTYWKNFWSADIHEADVIFVYLLPWKMNQLAAKLHEECKPGALIVSNSFIFPGWNILRQDVTHHVYVFHR